MAAPSPPRRGRAPMRQTREEHMTTSRQHDHEQYAKWSKIAPAAGIPFSKEFPAIPCKSPFGGRWWAAGVRAGKLKEAHHWTLPDLLDFTKAEYVLNLCWTNKYYPMDECKERALVEWAPVQGHGRAVLPQELAAVMFFIRRYGLGADHQSVVRFPKPFVVHCTHGVNRTGFVLVSYAIYHLGMTLDDAMDSFHKARGIKIEERTTVSALTEVFNEYIYKRNTRQVAGMRIDSDQADRSKVWILAPKPAGCLCEGGGCCCWLNDPKRSRGASATQRRGKEEISHDEQEVSSRAESATRGTATSEEESPERSFDPDGA